MKMKIYLTLLVIISIISPTYLALGSVDQVDPEIKIVEDISQSKYTSSNDIPKKSTIKCKNCNGKGIIECTACKGCGEKVESRDCKTCGGSGKIYKNHNITNCTDCHDGRIVESSICNICNGLGRGKCQICRGDGII